MSSNYNKLLKKNIYISRDPFWYDDIRILFNYERMNEFFPSKDMTLEEQLNSLVRLTLYISLIFMLYKKQITYIYILIFALIFTFSIYTLSDKSIESFESDEKKYISPTRNNPFMNISPNDYIDHPNRDSLNKVNNYINPDLNKEIDKHFNYNLYRDVDDIYNRKSNQRQFYTMPVTTIPNTQEKFAKWLYLTPPTCKEGNSSQCIAQQYNHLKDSKVRNGIY